MLRIQVNKRDTVPSYRSLGETSAITVSLVDGKVALSGFGIGGMSVGDRIRFVRKDCRGDVAFIDTTTIAEILGGAIILNPLPDIKLDGAEVKLSLRKVPNGSLFNALEISGRHCYIDNPEGCNVDVKENVIGKYTDYDKNKRRCVNDYITYDSCFLYQATGVTSDNKYKFPNANAAKNKKVKIKLLNDIVYKQYIGRYGNNWDARNTDGIIWLTNCVVPVDGDGTNVMNKLIWEGSVSTGMIAMAMPNENGVYENGVTHFACENERYYSISGSTVSFKPNVEVFLEENCIRISGALEENFDVNLFQRDAIEKKFFFEKNKTIDFEKQIFYPVYGQNLKNMSSISYNIYFRQRTGVEQPTDGTVADYEEGIKKWKINEHGKWNVTATTDSPYGDLVGYAGFTDDDIYYQKKKVGMSFLRLSLYDTKDRLTQSLLGYSTMFLDSTAFYKKYVLKKNRAVALEQKDKYIVFRTDDPQLGINFSCANKYNSDQSSEGFYLYLFPSLLETQPKSGDWSLIYMKAEFNNAKYGKTVPFINVINGMPKDDYIETVSGDTENTYVDMNALFEDMYIEIKIKYDKNTKRYVWRFSDYDSADVVINLFEPRVNG